MKLAFFVLLTFLLLMENASAQSNLTDKLAAELNRIENYLPQRDSLDPSVSAVPVAWHLDHSLKVILAIHESLAASAPSDYEGSFNFLRIAVFTAGRFPRGVAKAPESVLPPAEITTDSLRIQLAEARAMLPFLKEIDRKQFYDHFKFGKLNRRRTVRFMRIHTRHHLRIVEDILGGKK